VTAPRAHPGHLGEQCHLADRSLHKAGAARCDALSGASADEAVGLALVRAGRLTARTMGSYPSLERENGK